MSESVKDGYVKSYRKRFKNKLFRGEKFCRGYAWDWLVSHAVFQPYEIDLNGKTVTLERGQLCYSLRYLAEVFGWSKSTTERFLTRLKTETMIETQSGTGQMIITICNYEKYQGEIFEAGQQTGQQTGQQRDSSGTNKKNDKKDKKESNKKPDTDLFGDSVVPTPLSILGPILGDELAQDWLTYRKDDLKKPMSTIAAKQLANSLTKVSDPKAAVRRAIVNRWQGVVFEDRLPANSAQPNGMPKRSRLLEMSLPPEARKH